MKKTISAAAIALLTLTACSTSVEQDATYDSPQEFADALNSINDFDCNVISSADKLETEGWAGISCWANTANLYGSDHKRQWIYDRNPLDPGERRLEGPNWSFQGDQYVVEQVQEELGGTIEPATN